MTRIVWLSLIAFLFPGFSTWAQHTLWPVHSIEVSQNTNYYIHTTSDKKVFISSTDGLNIYDGQHTRLYRPSTHNMHGYNIQSPFFEDAAGRIWFTTYEALHYYDPAIDDLIFMFMVSDKGDTLKSNYKAFHLEGDLLFLKAEQECFIYNIATGVVVRTMQIDFHGYYLLALCEVQGKRLLFGSDLDKYKVYDISNASHETLIAEGRARITAVMPGPRHLLWTGDLQGQISLFDPGNGRFHFSAQVSSRPITGMAALPFGQLLVSTSTSELMVFDTATKLVVDRIKPVTTHTREHVHTTIIPYIDQDSTFWMGGDNQGVFFTNLTKRKFDHFLSSNPGQGQISVTRIIPNGRAEFLILTRKGGIILINAHGERLYHWNSLPDGTTDFTALSGLMQDEHHLLFSSYNKWYRLDTRTKTISSLRWTTPLSNPALAQMDRLSNGKIICSLYDQLLMELVSSPAGFEFKPYAKDLQHHTQLSTYFKEDKRGNIYISNDEVTLLILEPNPSGEDHIFSYELPIAGGIKGLAEVTEADAVYVANTHGLFHIDRSTRAFHQIIDREKLLLQTIYSVMADAGGRLWLSTNKGLLRYEPVSGQVIRFSVMDGVQASEYNTHACLAQPDGSMFFGGVNGLNFFHPEKIRFSERIAPVRFSEWMINDEPYSLYHVPRQHKSITLPYRLNTISFGFHAVDFSDPGATRVQYKLDGVDEFYLQSREAEGFARYPNLRPGHYVFSVLGANADGFWNTIPETLDIHILPPFWMTWWFITLAILIGVALMYILIRAYYRRKLEKKNMLLREQALIIEKQQAIEHERTRIASEMHDDLGSGLTTIRYLSDKALLQAKDTGEADQIRRIAEHSNRLVRNMSEIIWAMNARFDNADSLVGYLRRYASEFLEEHQIPFGFVADGDSLNTISMGGEKRRNVFLVFKEMLHNTVKYAGAHHVRIQIGVSDILTIHIEERGGTGFDPEQAIEKGNGLFNARKRMASIGGTIRYQQTPDAMHIYIIVPIQMPQV